MVLEGEGQAGAGDAGASGVPAGDAGASGAAGGAAAAAATTPPAGGDPAAALAGAAAYAPNFKYKVLKEEREIPEWARSIVTSADAEKQVRDLFERADGLPEVKAHRDQLVNENAQMREHWAPVVQNVQQVVGMLQRKDYDTFFKSLNIPEADVLRYALTRIQLREQPQALAAHEEMVSLRNQNLTYQQQVQSFQEQMQQTQVQQLTNEIDTTLARSEVLPAVQAFDARMGTPGAFRTEVIRRGKAYDAMGQNVPAGQVVGEILQLIGFQPGQVGAQTTVPSAASGAGAAGGGTPGAQAPKPVLPKIAGNGGSPAKKVFKTTDEIRKHARTLA